MINFELANRNGHTFCLVKYRNQYYIFQSDQINFGFTTSYKCLFAQGIEHPNIVEFNLIYKVLIENKFTHKSFIELFWLEPSNDKIVQLYWQQATLRNFKYIL